MRTGRPREHGVSALSIHRIKRERSALGSGDSEGPQTREVMQLNMELQEIMKGRMWSSVRVSADGVAQVVRAWGGCIQTKYIAKAELPSNAETT